MSETVKDHPKEARQAFESSEFFSERDPDIARYHLQFAQVAALISIAESLRKLSQAVTLDHEGKNGWLRVDDGRG